MTAASAPSLPGAGQHERHRAFLNRYYGISRHFYDLTRKYYLFGRDQELDKLAGESWQTLLEVGPGTGRNLKKLHRRRPDAHLGGIEASDEMLIAARRSCPFATLTQGFAETAAYAEILGQPPERILFSYCLSMVEEPERAIEQAKRELPAGGQIVLVDFADFAALPRSAATALTSWLNTFHVHPISSERLQALGFVLEYGPGRYYLRGRLTA